MPSVTAVVHTLGILFETDYKSGGASILLSGVANGLLENHRSSQKNANPLATPRTTQTRKTGAYEKINRDSAIAVLKAFLETKPDYFQNPNDLLSPANEPSPFIYISAEDVFRPFVPERYILTKREAETRIQRMSETARSMLQQSMQEDNEFEQLERPQRLVKPVFVRPSKLNIASTCPFEEYF
jgi:hypothetical protein